MFRYLASKMASAMSAIVGASIVSFVFLRLAPGNPARLVLGPLASEEAIRSQEQKMGLDQSTPTQYWRFVSDFFQGDWGYSYTAGQPVMEQMRTRLPATIELGFYAFLLAFLLAVSLALVITYRRRVALDSGVRGFSFLALGTPPFWLALILLIVFFSYLGVAPGPGSRISSGFDPPSYLTGLYTVDALVSGNFALLGNALWHLILPSIALGFAAFGILVRILRANLLDVSNEPFILVVRSKGVSRWKTHLRHALPNAFLPTLTASGLLFAQLLGGSVLIEKVFDWPGIGSLIVDSILNKDFAVVQVFVLLSAFLYVVVNFVIDALYGIIDPRVRVSGGGRSR